VFFYFLVYDNSVSINYRLLLKSDTIPGSGRRNTHDLGRNLILKDIYSDESCNLFLTPLQTRQKPIGQVAKKDERITFFEKKLVEKEFTVALYFIFFFLFF
jgi:hypothetical protein